MVAENAGTASLVVTLSPAASQAVTVDFQTGDATATAPADYASAAGSLSFAPGETTKSVLVTVANDALDEADEQLTVTLSNAQGATLSAASATVTITDDDAAPAASVGAVTVGEGVPGATFTVSLSAPSGQSVVVSYATAELSPTPSATSGADFASTSGTVTFAPGETTKPVVVAITNDALDEADETFELVLSSPVNATLASGPAVGTITDDDDTPSLSVADVTSTEGTGTGTTPFTFTVTLSAASGRTVTVAYATQDLAPASAVAGNDYTATMGTLTFTPGQTSQPFTVPVNRDLSVEADERFLVVLSAPTNATVADAQATGTITNDDAPGGTPTISIAPATVAEGNAGTAPLAFTVTLSAASASVVTVNFSTQNGTATVGGASGAGGADYLPNIGQLTFAPGATTQNVTVVVRGDTVFEPNETFLVNLSGATNAIITTGSALGTITNDDTQPAVSVNSVSVTEGTAGLTPASFTVSLSNPSAQAVSVQFATAQGTATSGPDYAATNGTLTFAAGVVSQPVVVQVQGDQAFEVDETFFVVLSNVTNATLPPAGAQGTGTIVNDDAAPQLTVSDVSLFEGNSGLTTATFTVALVGQASRAVTVDYAVQADGGAGQASLGGDVVANTGTLTFNPGPALQTQQVQVLIVGDTVDELNETFTLALSNPTNATVFRAAGLGTIRNDDSPLPMAVINSVTASEGASLLFTVTLSRASTSTVTMNFATSNGSAVAPADYPTTMGQVTFMPGQTSRTVTVPTTQDTLDELEEQLTVTLSGAVGAFISQPTGTGTIADNDAQPIVSIASQAVAEGNSGVTTLTFTVTLSAASGRVVRVNYATADGTASSSAVGLGSADYVATSGTVVIPAGQTSGTFTVSVNGDSLLELNETFAVTLSNAVAATLGVATATGTITNDDAVPTVSVANTSVLEGNQGVTPLTFVVSLSNPTALPVTVSLVFGGGTATQGSDYLVVLNTPQVTIPAGQTVAAVTAFVVGDVTQEGNETVWLSATNAVNAQVPALPASRGVGTIENDD